MQLDLFNLETFKSPLFAYCHSEQLAVQMSEYWQEELAVKIPIQATFDVVGENDLPSGTDKIVPSIEYWRKAIHHNPRLIVVVKSRKTTVKKYIYRQILDD